MPLLKSSLRMAPRIIIGLLFVCLTLPCFAKGNYPVTNVHAKLTDHAAWLNTVKPLAAADLAGRVILVDFWTSGCINCMHIVPKLKILEQEFGDRLTVIGVHSAKFQAEGDRQNLEQAIAKYDIHHPVINDADFAVWDRFGIRAWPTLVLIGADGLVKDVYKGEGNITQMKDDIARVIAQAKGHLNTTPLPLSPLKSATGPLAFPAKIALYTPAARVTQFVISDSGHHRIVLVDPRTHAITTVIGSGERGYADGDFTSARFDSPQGVLIDGDAMYVADTSNHRLRRIDLIAQTVTTLAGTGLRGAPLPTQAEPALKTPLASPWDLAFYPDRQHIAVANAGTHQLGLYDIASQTVKRLAGSGAESIDDGPLPGNSLSQPSGLAAWRDQLYVVDAESSMLRVLNPDRTITTLIGTGLFDFGLRDGDRRSALMQHAQGVTTAADGRVFIADTYNQRVRLYQNGQLSTLPVTDLAQPGDVLVYRDRLYITDTNHHRILSTQLDGSDQTVLKIE